MLLLDWRVAFSGPDLLVAKEVAGARAIVRVLLASEQVANAREQDVWQMLHVCQRGDMQCL